MIPSKRETREEIYMQIGRGSLTGIVQSGALVIVGIILPPVILRYLNSSGYGRWVFFVSIASYLNLFEMGLTTGLTKVWSEQKDQENVFEVGCTFNTVFVFFAAVSLLGISLSWAVARLWPESFVLLPYFVLGVSINLLAEPLAGILRGFQRSDLVNITNAVIALLNALLVYCALYEGFGLLSIALAIVVSNLGRFLSFLFLIRHILPSFHPFVLGPFGSIRHILKLGATEQIMRVWVIAISPTNRILLFGILGASILTSYDLGSRMIGATALIPAVMFPPLIPAFSYLLSINDKAGVDNILFRANKYINMLGLPFCWFIIFFANPLTTAWLGRFSPDVALAARILLLGAFVNILTGPFTHALIGIGRPNLCIQKVLMGCILSFILPIGLCFAIGFVGFLIGECLAAAIPALIFLGRFQKEEGLMVVSEVSSMVIRTSLILLPLSMMFFLVYQISISAVIWQLFWVWVLIFVVFLCLSIFLYRFFGMLSPEEMRKVNRVISLKVPFRAVR